MAISIATNMASIRASNDLSRVNIDSSSRRERVVMAAPSFTYPKGMRAEIGGLTQGARNAEQALDLLRTAEGGMNEVSSILIRMREMAVQSSSDTLNDSNRESLDAEFGQLKEHIDRIVGLANYNEQSLLRGFGNEIDASFSTALTDAADTGVRRITLSAALSGNYTFYKQSQ
jgi:flagellin